MPKKWFFSPIHPIQQNANEKKIFPSLSLEPGPPDPKSTTLQMSYQASYRNATWIVDLNNKHINTFLFLAFFKDFGSFKANEIPIFSGGSWEQQPLLRFFKSSSVLLYGARLLRYLNFCCFSSCGEVVWWFIWRVQILDTREQDQKMHELICRVVDFGSGCPGSRLSEERFFFSLAFCWIGWIGEKISF